MDLSSPHCTPHVSLHEDSCAQSTTEQYSLYSCLMPGFLMREFLKFCADILMTVLK